VPVQVDAFRPYLRPSENWPERALWEITPVKSRDAGNKDRETRSGSWKRGRVFGAREVDPIPVHQSFRFRPLSEELPAGSDRLRRLSISRAHWGGRGLSARNGEFSDFPARYDAPGSIVGHPRGFRVRAVYVLPDAVGTKCNRASHPGKTQMKANAEGVPPDGDRPPMRQPCSQRRTSGGSETCRKCRCGSAAPKFGQ
jgi:hypothetical protein